MCFSLSATLLYVKRDHVVISTSWAEMYMINCQVYTADGVLKIGNKIRHLTKQTFYMCSPPGNQLPSRGKGEEGRKCTEMTSSICFPLTNTSTETIRHKFLKFSKAGGALKTFRQNSNTLGVKFHAPY